MHREKKKEIQSPQIFIYIWIIILVRFSFVPNRFQYQSIRLNLYTNTKTRQVEIYK